MNCAVGTDIDRAAVILRSGGLVAFPTETVYGLGADALDPAAVARLFEAKRRPRFDPIIAHIAKVSWIERVVAQYPAAARLLAERFWPGPLTLVLPKTKRVPDLLTAGLPSVAVRVPDHSLALQLLRAVDRPLAAPSANLFGRLSPTCVEHVVDQFGGMVEYILDGGSCAVGIESTVIDFSKYAETGTAASPAGSRAMLLRPGGIAAEEIEALIGPLLRREASEHGAHSPATSPGMLPKHYAPQTPLLVGADREASAGRRAGLLAFKPENETAGFVAIEVLSVAGDLTEAAANFFAALRRLDALELDLIIARPFPDEGLGVALNDRLRRAAIDPPEATSTSAPGER
jgi:L-threonylcarbamoyladenylate synthase